MLGLGLNIRPRIVKELQPETLAYITAAGYTNGAVISAIDDYIGALKTNSLYSAIIKGHLFITDSDDSSTQLNQFKWNFKNPLDTNGAYRITPVNSPSTSKAGSSSFNGTTQYWETYFNYNTVFGTTTQNVGIMTFFLGTTIGVAGVIESNSTFRANQTILNNGSYTNGCIGRETGTTSVHANGTGSFAVNTTGSNNQTIFYQGVQETTTTTTFRGQPIGTESIGRRAGSALLYGLNGICAHLTFQGLSNAQVLTLMSLTNELQGAIEIALSLPSGTRKKY